jgi:hypothetical protein
VYGALSAKRLDQLKFLPNILFMVVGFVLVVVVVVAVAVAVAAAALVENIVDLRSSFLFPRCFKWV